MIQSFLFTRFTTSAKNNSKQWIQWKWRIKVVFRCCCKIQPRTAFFLWMSVCTQRFLYCAEFATCTTSLIGQPIFTSWNTITKELFTQNYILCRVLCIWLDGYKMAWRIDSRWNERFVVLCVYACECMSVDRWKSMEKPTNWGEPQETGSQNGIENMVGVENEIGMISGGVRLFSTDDVLIYTRTDSLNIPTQSTVLQKMSETEWDNKCALPISLFIVYGVCLPLWYVCGFGLMWCVNKISSIFFRQSNKRIGEQNESERESVWQHKTERIWQEKKRAAYKSANKNKLTKESRQFS